MCRRSASGARLLMSWPLSSTWPLSGSTSRLMSRSRVDLPEPEAPISAVICPRGKVSDTASSARTAP